MELKYKVSEDAYNRYVQTRRRAKMRRPLNILFTIVLTAFPLVILGLCIAQQLFTGGQLAAMAVFCVALSGINLAFRLGYWHRTSRNLDAMKRDGRINDDFWKEHRLSISEDWVRLAAGGFSTEYSWASFGGFEEMEGLLLPVFNAKPLDLIPLSALERMGGTEAFQRDFVAIAKQGLQAAFAQEKEAFTPRMDMHHLSYDYTKADYIRDQRDARRMRYTTRLVFNKSVSAKLTLTLVMIYLITTSTSALATLLYALVILALNYEHIAAFTPILERQLETMLRPILVLQPEHHVELYADLERVTVMGDVHYIDLPMSEIIEVRKTAHSLALYLASQTILTIPAPPATSERAFDRLSEHLSGIVKMNRS